MTVVWACVVAASAWAPAIVTGADRERLAVAPIGDWLWGALATGLILLAVAVSRGGSERLWTSFTVLLAAIWAVMALASVFAPDLVVEGDQTRIPLAALISPLAATVGTAFACVFASGSARET